MASSSSSSANPAPPDPGSTVGGYIIGPPLGKGSFAVVHKAFRANTDNQPESSKAATPAGLSDNGSSSTGRPIIKDLAVKIVARQKLNKRLLQNLQSEIDIMRTVTHANIVELADCIHADSHIYLFMDFCAGGDLAQYIKGRGMHPMEGVSLSRSFTSATRQYPHPTDGGLNRTMVRSFLEQLASAMQFMRARNIVHRDIKPQNLLLRPPQKFYLNWGHPAGIPQLKVADFGFARSLPAASLAETLCGSPLYMAPEILRHEKYDAKADLWSIGAVTFEMLVGTSPFKAQNAHELLRKIERADDVIRFPDERSLNSWKERVKRRRDAGEAVSAEEEARGPTPIDDDVKALVRGLMKRNAISRMSFEEFFNHPVILGARPPGAHKDQTGLAKSIEKITPEPTPSLATTSPPRPVAAQGLPLQPAPSTRVQAPPALVQKAPLPTFAPKLVTRQSSKSSQASTPARVPTRASATTTPTKDVQSTSSASPHPPGSDVGTSQREATSAGPSTANASPAPSVTGSAHVEGDDDSQYVIVERGIGESADTVVNGPKTQAQTLSKGAFDVLNAAGKVARRPSRLTRLGTDLTTAPGRVVDDALTTTTETDVPATGTTKGLSTPPAATSALSTSPSAAFVLPPNMRRPSSSRRISGSSPRPIIRPSATYSGTSPTTAQEDPSVQPPALSPPNLNAYPGSALARAISNASQRLLTGMPTGFSLRNAASAMRNKGFGGLGMGLVATPTTAAAAARAAGAAGQTEIALLLRLEDCSQKAFVLSEFADSKMSLIWPEGPHQHLHQGSWTSQAGASGAATYMHRRSTSLSSSAHSRDGGASTGPDLAWDAQASLIARESLLVYLESISFLRKGLDLVGAYIDSLKHNAASSGSHDGAGISVNPEIKDAITCLDRRFEETKECASFARSRISPEPPRDSHESPPSSTPPSSEGRGASNHPGKLRTASRIIYDKAMEIARAAAMDELENNHASTPAVQQQQPSSSSPITAPSSSSGLGSSGPHASLPAPVWDINACLLAYETAAVMLTCLADQQARIQSSGNADEGAAESVESTAAGESASSPSASAGVAADVFVVEPFIKSIQHRCSALRKRIDEQELQSQSQSQQRQQQQHAHQAMTTTTTSATVPVPPQPTAGAA